jgi:hypothetical protein
MERNIPPTQILQQSSSPVPEPVFSSSVRAVSPQRGNRLRTPQEKQLAAIDDRG